MFVVRTCSRVTVRIFAQNTLVQAEVELLISAFMDDT